MDIKKLKQRVKTWHEGQTYRVFRDGKFVDDSYFDAHIIPVYETLLNAGADETLRCVGLTHDVVEDPNPDDFEDYILSLDDGVEIVDMTADVTNVFTSQAYPKMIRKDRARKEAERLSQIPMKSKCVKLADMIVNLSNQLNESKDDIEDKRWCRRYAHEKREVFTKMNLNIEKSERSVDNDRYTVFCVLYVQLQNLLREIYDKHGW